MAYYPPIQFENFLRALENLGSSRVSMGGTVVCSPFIQGQVSPNNIHTLSTDKL